ncbi:MAG TPA: TIGR03617 family F420-dependent LLM class oxidoreductase [Candidatus Limnocylindrales bacterium]|nr:TIGR03617 family F420-dependent LLM class oxidoreductase [Candidatus Limnocylindrales bacterium]
MKVDVDIGDGHPARIGALARAAETLGFDAGWVTETRREPFVAAALALAATHRLQVGTGVAIAFARSPLVIASAAFDLAALSGGRFLLGLGSQVRGHVVRRFGMPWSAPAPRLGEWIGAIRAAWANWQEGAPFVFRSEHLDLSLMPDFFRPPPLEFDAPAGRPRIELAIAGVGPHMARLAGRAADGLHVHPFHTARYLDEVIEPALAAGEAERDPTLTLRRCERLLPVFVVPSEDVAAREAVRGQVAFYASTPAYRAVLRLHGRERAGERLSRLAATGRWAEMPALIDDELLAEVAVVAPLAALPDALAARVGGHAQRVMPLLPLELEPDGTPSNGRRWEGLIAALRSA